MTEHAFAQKLALTAALAAAGVGNAHATLESYTNFTDFEDALAAAGLTSVLHDFNAPASGTPINDGDTVDGITFDSISLETGVLQVVSSTDTTEFRSPPKGIGTSAADGQMRNPDSFTMSFPASHAFGVWFIMESTAFDADGDFSLTVNGQTQDSSAGEAVPLAGNTNNYASWFIGFTDATSPFTSADLASTGDFAAGTFLFRVDDAYTAQAAPLPSSLVLLALGASIMGWRHNLQAKRPLQS